MKVNDKLYGFTIKRIRPLDELSAEFVEMIHDKTGLELVWINRDEENKTFGIAFETLPFDDTGVFHILEHSVLCGSEKYPVKEPFVDLLQTSMNTFLNAMTFQDKTLYPVSSRNDEDFFNLMSVYLDAVFRPEIYNKPEIFYQEGWHYELDENGSATYKGVVFNEMKGVFASADELEELAINRAIFPDSPYKYVSGGDPASIPDLTYEGFIESHKKFYSPSNAYVYFDGSVDIERALEYLDSEYLSRAERGERLAPPEIQRAVDGGTTEVEYELGEDESTENKTRIAWANVIGSFDEREKIIAMQVISDVLCGSNQSVLTKAVLSQGLAEDLIMQVIDGISQPWLRLEAQNITDGKANELEALIFDRLEHLAENGIDHAQLEATMANIEFQLRERDYGSFPQGIYFGFLMLETWLYGGDPIKPLSVGDIFDRLRAKMEDGYFEELIREILLNNNHKAKVVLVPSHTVGEARRAKEQSRLDREAALWNDVDKQEILDKQTRLIKWQSSEDSEEAVATLPRLSLADISAKPEELPTEVCKINDITALYHDINCSGILNYSLYFDAENLNEQEICELSFLTDILSKMKTSKYSEEEIDRLNRLLFGVLDFSVASYPIENNREQCKIKLAVQFGTLEKNIDDALAFVAQLLTDTQLDNEATALDLIKQLKTKYFHQIVMSGSSVGMGRIAAQNTAAGVANECAGGFEYYKWLCAQEKNWKWNELKGRLQTLMNEIIVSSKLTISLTGGNKKLLSNAADFFAEKLEKGKRSNAKSVIKPWGKKKEGIVIPADICFACAGGTFSEFKGYNGSLAVVSKIISLAYLWSVIRVQGGAYGTGFVVNRAGLATAYSYRDPNGVGSLEAYKKMAEFIESFCNETDDISGFIIGTIASAMPLVTPKMKGSLADRNYFSGLTDEARAKTIEDMLSTTTHDLAENASAINAVFDNAGVCVIGGREQLNAIDLDSIETL